MRIYQSIKNDCLKVRGLITIWNIILMKKERGHTVARFGMPITKVFRKVLADGSNSAKVISFSSSFVRPI